MSRSRPQPKPAGARKKLLQAAAQAPTQPVAIDPAHYADREIEPIAVIEAWNLGYKTGCAVKYIGRADHKGTRKADLLKAANYLFREATGKWLPKSVMGD